MIELSVIKEIFYLLIVQSIAIEIFWL